MSSSQTSEEEEHCRSSNGTGQFSKRGTGAGNACRAHLDPASPPGPHRASSFGGVLSNGPGALGTRCDRRGWNRMRWRWCGAGFNTASCVMGLRSVRSDFGCVRSRSRQIVSYSIESWGLPRGYGIRGIGRYSARTSGATKWFTSRRRTETCSSATAIRKRSFAIWMR